MADEIYEDDPNQTVVEQMPPEQEQQGDPFLYTLTSQTPWWIVSIMFHGLIILLAYMFSIAYNLDTGNEEPLVTVTQLQRPIDDLKKEPPKKNESVLAGKTDTHPTDPTSKEQSDIEVPPDILAKAELGDHFETINPDRPDTHSAFGNPDAHMFHSVTGSDDAAGGGGNNGATLEDMIGAGGARSPGDGGGWGGGHGTGIGNDTGPGHGSFGNRNGGGRRLMVKRHGGSKATENTCDSGLNWLAYHQYADGHFGGNGIEETGLSLLAFLGAGHSEKVGEYKSNVKQAVSWLIAQQRENGQIGVTTFEHAVGTMALSEAAAMSNIPNTRDAAQRAINRLTEDLQ